MQFLYKMFSPKKFLVKKTFWVKRLFGQKKLFGSKDFLVKKKVEFGCGGVDLGGDGGGGELGHNHVKPNSVE